jgi:ribulose-phosphate 3-epimerase
MRIIPTTGLHKNFDEAEERLRQIKDYSRWIQVDVCDNVFAAGKTFELELLKKISFNTDNVLWDIHLMVKEPIDWIEKCMFIGASRIIGQVEMMTNRDDFVSRVKDTGLEVGLAFDVETIINQIPKEVDEILIMGRKAGFGYFEMDKSVVKRVKQAKQIANTMAIAIDGGVDVENVKMLENEGVEIVYSEKNYFDLVELYDNQGRDK